MSKRAATSGIAVAGSLMLALTAGEAAAQQGYYPQAGTSPVTIKYGALSPYAAPGYQPYGGVAYGNPQPQSQFTPQGALPVYGAPGSQFMPGQVPVAAMPQPGMVQPGMPIATGGPGYGQTAYNPITYTASPIQAPFVAPYGNPAGYAQPQMGGLPSSTPQSYLNVPGQAPMALMGTPQPGAKPFDPNSLKPKKRKAAEPSQVEAAAAAQVAAVEEQLEANVAPADPVPPAAPSDVPDNVPSPVEDAAVITPPAAPAAPAATETAIAETAPAEATSTEGAAAEPAVIEPPAEESTETAAEPAEEPAADGGAQAALPGNATRIVYEADADELPAGASAQLDAVASSMMSDENIKVQVLAYASGSGDNESQARRKALSRGLEVRKYLINKGVRSNRIDVRALGSKSEGSPADRVDIVPAAAAG